MPSWITHFVTANKVCDKLKVNDKNSFLFGNIMPDILNNYIVKQTNIHLDYDTTHFRKNAILNGVRCEIPDIDKFYNEYSDKMNNPVVLGFFIHLLTDCYWNTITYSNYFKSHDDLLEIKLANGKTRIEEYDTAIKIKQLDFAIFTRLLKKRIYI